MTTNRWLCVLLAAPLAACGLVGVQGSGEEATEERKTAAFHAVSNQMNIEVDILEGKNQEVLVTCDDNLLTLITTEVREKTLYIQTPTGKSIRPQARCEVLITIPSLTWVEGTGSGRTTAAGALESLRWASTTGSGSVEIDGTLLAFQSAETTGSGSLVVRGIDTQSVQLTTTGSGSLVAAGVAGDVNASSSGSGAIEARKLHTETANVDLSGSGGLKLTVSDYADVSISGSGSASLWGKPDVSKKTTGSGELVLR